MRLEEVNSPVQSSADIFRGLDFHAGCSGQLRDIFGVSGSLDIDGLVRTEGRADLEAEVLYLRELLVPLKRIDRIIGRADESDIGLSDDAADRQIGIMLQHVGCLVPDLLRVVHGQGLIDAEILLQLQIAPVVHRVADGHFERLCQLCELDKRICAAGYLVFARAVGTHQSPFVMISEICAVRVSAAEPDFRDVVVAAVFIDLLRGDVAVIIDDRQVLCIIVEKMLRCIVIQHEILVHETLHDL